MIKCARPGDRVRDSWEGRVMILPRSHSITRRLFVRGRRAPKDSGVTWRARVHTMRGSAIESVRDAATHRGSPPADHILQSIRILRQRLERVRGRGGAFAVIEAGPALQFQNPEEPDALTID